jgi:hypothetical protein
MIRQLGRMWAHATIGWISLAALVVGVFLVATSG